MKIGLFGGTFDPIHLGHLIIAEEVLEKLSLDQILFVPSGIPPHKRDRKISDPELRLEMTRLAIEGNERFKFSDFEVRRESTSFTIETAEYFRDSLEKGAQLFLIVGADSILEISTWKEPRKLVSECRPVVVTRPGFDLAGLEPWLRDRVTIVDSVLLSISSTEIRQRVADGRTIRYLVPPAVAAFIFEHRLYARAFTA